MKKLKEWLPYIIIIVFILLFRTFVATPAVVNGYSMETTLHDKELVMVNKINLKKNLKRFDIVIAKTDKELLIKRVIGLPNEKIEYRNNKLYINGKEIEDKVKDISTNNFKVETKNNEYYLLGDNRTISKDSRYFGPFNINKIKGRVKFIIYPFNRFGKIEV